MKNDLLVIPERYRRQLAQIVSLGAWGALMQPLTTPNRRPMLIADRKRRGWKTGGKL